MKNLKALTFLMAMLCHFYGANSQTTQTTSLGKIISVDYKNLRLKEILNDLSGKYNLQFSYSNEQVPLDKKMSLHAVKKPVNVILDQLLKPAGLNYTVIGNQIILKPARARTETEAQVLFQTIRGIVTDLETKLPLPGVNIALKTVDPVVYVTTNENGEFRIPKVAIGRHDVEFSYTGYKKHSLSGLLIGSGKEVVLNIQLKESSTMLNAVVITDKSNHRQALNEMATVSSRSFSVEETNRYPVSWFDPARMALNFAGVSSDSDISNDIVVRGNSPKGLLWRLEGVEIINPNHFGEEGSSGGGVSMISSNMLATSDFFTGAFPAEYGNALSGVFDLQFRKGNTEKRENTVMVGILGTEVSTEGPFKKGSKAYYLVNYRYSTLSLLDKAGVNPVPDGSVPVYQDIAFNLNFPSKAGTFSLFGLGGISSQDNEAERDFTKWDELSDKFDREYSYTSGSAGIKHLKIINDRTYLKNIISASYSRVSDQSDTLNNDYVRSVYGRDTYENNSFTYSG
ncbi:MAG TPA: carboxypeptidase regulatory-like domain-containing protein, partial [Sphingobacteriaceae bacterium]